MVEPKVVSGKSESMTLLPDSFLPSIGLVMVSHAFMDNNLQKAIFILGRVDFSIGVSFLSDMMTSKKSDIFKNLARTTEPGLSQLCKMLVLGELVTTLSTERNVIAHHVPDWVNGAESEIGYFKDVVKTYPQIRVQPPYVASIESLNTLS